MPVFMRLLFIVCLILPLCSFCQQKMGSRKVAEENNFFTKVEIEAGPNAIAWKKYLEKKAELPDSISQKIPAGSYTVVVRYIIDIHGSVGQVNAINDPGFGLGKYAVTLVKNYPGEWKPASQCGRLVKSYHQQSIVFKISD